MQQQRLVRLASEQAEGAAEKEGRRLEVAVLAAAQVQLDFKHDGVSTGIGLTISSNRCYGNGRPHWQF